MVLKIQVIALLFSFIFGIFFACMVKLNYRFLFCKKKLIQIFITFLFIMDMSLLYFLILKFINGGILHPYFLLLVLIGFYIGYSFSAFFRKK